MIDPNIDDIFDSTSPYYHGAPTFGTPAGAKNVFTDGLSPSAVGAGDLIGNMTVRDGYLRSENYVAGSTGWYLDPTTGEFNFGVSVDSLDIPDTTTANSMHVESDGDTYWGVNVASGFAAAPASVSKAGAAIFKSIQIGGATLQYQMGDGGIFTFGDGSDGDVVISVNTTLTRDMYYDDLTVNSSVTLSPAGYRIFVRGTLTLNGTISRNGNNGGNGGDSEATGTGQVGTAGAAGAALADGYLKGSVAGGAGGVGGTSGNNGVGGDGGAVVTNSIATSNGAAGGLGGSEFDIRTGAGGPGGTVTASNVKLIANWHLATLLDISSTGSTVKFTGAPGGGGGSGGDGDSGGSNDPGGGGGGGASGGGIIAIYARNFVIAAAGVIQSNGGNGGNGGSGNSVLDGGHRASSGGGGGGGNGGVIIMVYNTLTNAGTVTASGGTGGAIGTGGTNTATVPTAGSNGNAGNIYQFSLSL